MAKTLKGNDIYKWKQTITEPFEQKYARQDL